MPNDLSVAEKVAVTHTPGPWTFTLRATKTPCCDKTTSQIGYVKADTDHLEVAVLYLCDERQEANARLIAASPDLLTALKRLHETGLVRELDTPENRAALAAIAKAEGGAQ